MSQRIYFSGVGEPDLWNSRFLTGVSKQMLSFLTWDATPDLVQATWEWPKKQPLPFGQSGLRSLLRSDASVAHVAEDASPHWRVTTLKLLAEKGANYDLNDRLFHDDPLWRSIQEAKGV